MPSVVVVGGANVDIQGRIDAAAIAGDSNPGRVTRSPGGVGRNIAHGVAALGIETALITALGDDVDGHWIAEITGAAGVDLADAVWSSKPTAIYLAVLDETGELALAVNDMAILGELDRAVVDDRWARIVAADVVAVDCNVEAETLAAVADCGRPLFVDPVSAAKAHRIDGVLDRVHTIKPNRSELAALTGRPVADAESVEIAARSLLDRGVGRVVVSLGVTGVIAVEPGGTIAMPPPVVVEPIGSVTGAGDALLAGLVSAHLRGLDTAASLRSALDGVAVAIRATGSVSG